MGRRLRTAFLLGLLVGLVLALVRALGRERTTPTALTSPAPSLPRPAGASAAAPAAAAAAPPAPASAPPLAPAPAPSPVEERAWKAPVDGGCPEGYPIKAKESSRIFHQPGGLSYERTRPDRCYADAAAAQADGFRAAKR